MLPLEQLVQFIKDKTALRIIYSHGKNENIEKYVKIENNQLQKDEKITCTEIYERKEDKSINVDSDKDLKLNEKDKKNNVSIYKIEKEESKHQNLQSEVVEYKGSRYKSKMSSPDSSQFVKRNKSIDSVENNSNLMGNEDLRAELKINKHGTDSKTEFSTNQIKNTNEIEEIVLSDENPTKRHKMDKNELAYSFNTEEKVKNVQYKTDREYVHSLDEKNVSMAEQKIVPSKYENQFEDKKHTKTDANESNQSNKTISSRIDNFKRTKSETNSNLEETHKKIDDSNLEEEPKTDCQTPVLPDHSNVEKKSQETPKEDKDFNSSETSTSLYSDVEQSQILEIPSSAKGKGKEIEETGQAEEPKTAHTNNQKPIPYESNVVFLLGVDEHMNIVIQKNNKKRLVKGDAIAAIVEMEENGVVIEE